MNKFYKAIIRTILISLATMAVSFNAYAEIKVTASEAKEWADEFFAKGLKEHRFSGAGIIITKAGEPILMEGYGYSDYAQKKSFDVMETRFRIGSNTKTLTGTAVAQLLEQGKISDLNDPANKYLKRFQLEKNGGEDITIWDLLTHSAGYEDKYWHLATDYDQKPPVDLSETEIFKAEFTRPRGKVSTYGNYNTEVLSALVEDVTGQDIQTFFQQNILDPLHMNKSRLPLDLSQNPDLAKPSAFFPSGDAQEISFMSIHPFVAATGALETTLDDMGRFMTAHMEEGKNSNPLGLSKNTFQKLHQTHRANEPRLSGFGMTFMRLAWGQETIFGHGGNWPGFMSVMMMFPDSDVSLFVIILGTGPQANISEQLASLVTENRFSPREGVEVLAPMMSTEPFEAFMTKFSGPYAPLVAETEDSNIEKYIGTYFEDYRAHSTYEKFFTLLDARRVTTDVQLDGQGGLSFNGIGGYIQTAPGIFWNEQREYIIDFVGGQDGVFAFTPDPMSNNYRLHRYLPMTSAKRVSDIFNPLVLGSLFSLFTLVLFTGLGSPLYYCKSAKNINRYLPIGMVVCFTFIFLFLLEGYSEGDGLTNHMLLGHSGRIYLSIFTANIFAILSIWSAYLVFKSWTSQKETGIKAVISRLYLSIFSTSTIGISLILFNFKLVGFYLP